MQEGFCRPSTNGANRIGGGFDRSPFGPPLLSKSLTLDGSILLVSMAQAGLQPEWQAAT
jgi:hypothetical protein